MLGRELLHHLGCLEDLRGGVLATAGDRDPAALPWEIPNGSRLSLLRHLRMALAMKARVNETLQDNLLSIDTCVF
jgi:hypothetical protein